MGNIELPNVGYLATGRITRAIGRRNMKNIRLSGRNEPNREINRNLPTTQISTSATPIVCK